MTRIPGNFARLAGIVLAIAAAPPWQTSAQESGANVELSPAAAVYLVIRDANIRARPETQSPRVGSIKKGTRIQSAGKAKGTEWVAVTEDGKVVGYVYAPVLAATIDGALKGDLTGETDAAAGPSCRHRVRFVGKSRVQGEPLETADYQVAFQCRQDGAALDFDAVMFITEIPYQRGEKDIYQINVDIPEIADTVEQVLSVTAMYHAGDGEVVFDAISDAEMASGRAAKKRPARSVAEALSGAVEIALSAWGPDVWKRLAARRAANSKPTENQ